MGEPSAEARSGHIVPGNLTGDFAIALRQAKRQAGDLSYYVLAEQVDCSLPTITRAFSGAALPRWRTVEGILKALRVPREQIDTDWRDLWVQALNERKPLLQSRSSGLTEDAPDGPQATGAISTASPASPRTGMSSPQGPGQSPPCVCEDCGALVGDVVQHQAWHWRIERQLRRSVIRPVGDAAHKEA